MASWSELPLVSIAQNSTFVPQFYIPELIQTIQESAKFYQYAESGDKYGYKDRVGQTFSINVTDTVGTQMVTGGTLGSGTKIPLTNIKSYNVVGTIGEYGIGVKMEKYLLNVSPSDIEGKQVRVALANTLTDCLDTLVRNQVYGATSNVCYGGTWTATGKTGVSMASMGTYANFKMTWSSLQRIREQKLLQNVDAGIPFFVHPYQMTDLMQDTTATSGFVPVSQYTERGVSKLFDGEIGDVLGLRVIVSNRVAGSVASNSEGTVTVVKAFGFTPRSVAMFYAMQPEMRYEPNYDTDFGRTSALAIYFQGCAKLLVDRETFQLWTTVKSSTGVTTTSA